MLAKVATVERCLARIADVRGRRAELTPLDLEDLVLVNLTRAAQAAIDLAAHVVATEAFGLPDSLAANFTLLEQHGVLDGALAARLRGMVGFRNVAVHAYQDVDARVVEAIVDHHLDDLRELAGIVVERYLGG